MCPHPLWATGPTYDIFENLGFGQFAVRNNNGIYAMTVDENNDFSYDVNGFISAADPQRGEYIFEDLPPSTSVTMVVDDTELSLDGLGGSPRFSVRDFTYNPLTTDGSGAVLVFLGATLRTSGTSQHYESGSYSGETLITVSY